MTDRTGDFRSRVAALLPQLRRFALALTGTAHDADDLVQAAIEKALTREAQWRPDTRLDSWMYKIVQNHWIDQTRSRRRRGEHAPIEDTGLHLVAEDGREVVENRDLVARARIAFAALAPELKATAVLVILNGASYKDAAETLGVPIGTVMSRVARSRRALEGALGAAQSRRAP